MKLTPGKLYQIKYEELLIEAFYYRVEYSENSLYKYYHFVPFFREWKKQILVVELTEAPYNLQATLDPIRAYYLLGESQWKAFGPAREVTTLEEALITKLCSLLTTSSEHTREFIKLILKNYHAT